MKLLRYGAAGLERPAALDTSGAVRDLSSLMPDITPECLSPARLAALARVDLATLPVLPPGERIGVPVAGIRQFMAIGLNYHDHALESGMAPPEEPVVFTKAITSLAGTAKSVACTV